MPEALGSTPLPQKEEGRKEGRGEGRKGGRKEEKILNN
jgi:hypothetical protein